MTSLSVGDVAPPFGLPSDSGDSFDLYADNVAGRFTAIVFCPAGVSAASSQLKCFANAYDSLHKRGVVVVAVSHEPPSVLAKHRKHLALPFELLSDHEHKLFAGYGVVPGDNDIDSEPVTLVLRPNQHLLAIVRDGLQGETTLDMIRQEQDAHTETALGFQPPILMVPDVLARDDCQRLIEVYNKPDVPIVEWSEIDDIDGDVKTKVPDYDRQDRIDHFITSEELKTHIGGRLRLRLLREIKKAFHYTVTTFEGLRIGCYEGERGGQAHGHRDNSLPDVAHRRFALSINLNAEEFEGGEIRFPEFGMERYKPQTGAAFVFSCSLLHEALAVTHGRRFVLLAFLNGDQ